MLPNGTNTQIKSVIRPDKNGGAMIEQVHEAIANLCPENHCNWDTVDLMARLIEYRREALQYLNSTYGKRFDYDNLVIETVFELTGYYCRFIAMWLLLDSNNKALMKANSVTVLTQWQIFTD